MISRITIAILNYKRPANVHRIITGLRAQTQPCRIFLWDNSEHAESFTGVDWLVRSTVNSYCWPRWFMLANAETEFVMTIDDDIELASPTALETILGELEQLAHQTQIIGPEGVLLSGTGDYFPRQSGKITQSSAVDCLDISQHLSAGEEDHMVDIVKGRSMAMAVSAVRQLPLFVGRNEVCDDIAVSSLLSGGRKRAHRVPAHFRGLFSDLPEKNGQMALSNNANWRSIRNAARERFFPKDVD